MSIKTVSFKERFREMKDLVNTAMQDVFIKRGFLNTAIITEWNSIVGQDLCKKYRPSKIVNNGKKVILFLDATTLRDRQYITYNRNILIEKVNIFLGHKAVDDVKIVD